MQFSLSEARSVGQDNILVAQRRIELRGRPQNKPIVCTRGIISGPIPRLLKSDVMLIHYY
jgi:hypothetical protein